MNPDNQSFGTNKDCSRDTIITGIAEHSKAGAVVLTDSGLVYYIQNKYDWDKEGLHKVRIRVCGTLKKFYTSEKELGYKDKAYKQGIIGEQLILENASWTRADIVHADIGRDSVFILLRKKLPDNWECRCIGDTLQIIRKDSVWRLFENQINAPINTLTVKEQEDKIKKYGRLIHSRFEYSLIPRLSDKEMTAIRENNRLIHEQVNLLPRKFKIEHLAKNSKKGIIYFAKSEEEKQLVLAFEKERDELLKGIIALPDYHSELFSLYLMKEEGMNDEFSLIYPTSASEEMWNIRQELIQTILINP